MKIMPVSALLLLGAFTASDIHAQGRRFQLPPQAEKIVEGAYYLGQAKDRDGQIVDGIAFLHPKPGAAKPEGAGGGKPPKGGGDSNCYAFLADGARWRVVEDFFVDASNTAGLDPLGVETTIAAALGEWETAAGADIFGDYGVGQVSSQDLSVMDDRNEFSFGAIAEQNVIAVTVIWGVFRGPAKWRELREWDMICDQQDFDWSLDGSPGAMDFENIFQHEAGHAAGLGHPSASCTEETMYAYAGNGETKKRDLNAGDIAGIIALYQQ